MTLEMTEVFPEGVFAGQYCDHPRRRFCGGGFDPENARMRMGRPYKAGNGRARRRQVVNETSGSGQKSLVLHTANRRAHAGRFAVLDIRHFVF
jgi:hypothetical protein